MASFIKRNGRWTARVRKTGYPETTQTFPNKASALKWSQRVESDPEKFLAEQLPEDHQLRTVGDLVRNYGKEVTPQKKGRDKERFRLRVLQRSYLSGVSLSELKPHHITKFREDRLKEVSAGTVLKDLGLLSAVINTGMTKWGLENVLRSNPVSLISKPRAPRPRDRRLEAGELERLLAAGASPNPWFRVVVLFAIETGTRRGETLSLTWENVHLGKRYVHLPDTKNGDSRDVPLSPQALELLRDLPKDIREDQVVFPLHFEALKSSLRRACSKACISDIRFHDLRHEATSRFFEKGLNVMDVYAITGHKDLRILQRYTHLWVEDPARKLG